MNIKKYLKLENDLEVAKINLRKRFKDLVKDEFGVQFDGTMDSSFLGLKRSGKNYFAATYDFNGKDSFKNEFLTLDQVDRFIKVIKKLEE